MKPIEIERAKARPLPDIALLYKAFSLAQGEFPDITKGRVANTGQYSYKYADLSDVIGAVAPVLAAHGLGFYQVAHADRVETVLFHESGASIRSDYPLDHPTQSRSHPAQARAGTVQMCKRYALCALLGVSAEETVEGDNREQSRGKRQADEMEMDGEFRTPDGIRAPRGVKHPLPSDPAELARAYAEAIIEQFAQVKTLRGMPGAWDRNASFIDRMKERYPELSDNIQDAYSAREKALRDG